MRKRIGLIDFDGRQVNVALMRLSTYHKRKGHTVILNPSGNDRIDQAYVSVLFSWNRERAAQLAGIYPRADFGGTGWDVTKTLPAEVEACPPDYDLYRTEDVAGRLRGIMTKKSRLNKARTIVEAGIGFLSRGCSRACSFCVVPKKEGEIHRVGSLAELINPRSNVVTLLDNNATAAPDAIEIFREIAERKLVVDLTQGIDVRAMTDEIALALSKVKFLRSLHMAWDLMGAEKAVLSGIDLLSRFVSKKKLLCFMLAGYNTTWEEDLYRFRKLVEAGVDPYVMLYNMDKSDLRLKHFARWVNGRLYKVCAFDDYKNWVRERDSYRQLPLFAAA